MLRIISSVGAPKNGDSTEFIPMAVATPASAFQKIPGLMEQTYTTTLNKNLGGTYGIILPSYIGIKTTQIQGPLKANQSSTVHVISGFYY